MDGSTLVFEKQRKRLAKLATDPEAIEDFEHVALEILTTLDFEKLCGSAKVAWSSGEPVVFDEAGLAVFRVSPEGIEHVLSRAKLRKPDERADLDRIRAFVAKHGNEHIYEVAAF